MQGSGKKAKELGSLEINLGDFAANGTNLAKDFKFAKYCPILFHSRTCSVRISPLCTACYRGLNIFVSLSHFFSFVSLFIE